MILPKTFSSAAEYNRYFALPCAGVGLKGNDAYRYFEDSIGTISDFDRRDHLYEMPYGVLVQEGFPTQITVDFSASGEGYAWNVLRVILPAIVSD